MHISKSQTFSLIATQIIFYYFHFNHCSEFSSIQYIQPFVFEKKKYFHDTFMLIKDGIKLHNNAIDTIQTNHIKWNKFFTERGLSHTHRKQAILEMTFHFSYPMNLYKISNSSYNQSSIGCRSCRSRNEFKRNFPYLLWKCNIPTYLDIFGEESSSRNITHSHVLIIFLIFFILISYFLLLNIGLNGFYVFLMN